MDPVRNRGRAGVYNFTLGIRTILLIIRVLGSELDRDLFLTGWTTLV